MKTALVFLTPLFFTIYNCSHTTQETFKESQIEKIPMKEQDYSTSFAVNNSPAEVFTAITNFRAWWSNQIEGSTDRLNELFLYHYKDVHLCKIKLIETVPDKKLVYQIVDNEFNFTKDKTEWINTELIFEISVEGGGRKNQSTVYA